VNINGTTYNDKTPAALVQALESARLSGLRVRLFFGDSETGADWAEENDVCGYIGRSCGTVKVPLLLHNQRSVGGREIMDNCVVRLQIGGRDVWRHPGYTVPLLGIRKPPRFCGTVDLWADGYVAGVYRNAVNVANFKTEAAARRWVAFMTGERGAK
jgi:hypothetical protein